MKISIITINYNNAIGLDNTIKSVISQSSNEYEYIIIDGGSSDESKNIIENYSNYFSFWVSEKDNGIYSAMNKGIDKANGEYCLFLNSGDFLASNSVIQDVVNEIAEHQGFDVYYGDLVLKNAQTNSSYSKCYPNKLSLNYFYNTTIGHPSSFISTKLLKTFGGYSENYKVISDWLFFTHSFLHNYKFKKIPILVSIYDIDGISSNGDIVDCEKNIAFENELSNFKLDFQLFDELVIYKKSRLHNFINNLLIFFKRRK